MSNTNRFVTLALILAIIGGLAFVAVNYNERINTMSEKLDNHKAEISSLREENTALKETVDELESSNNEQTSRIEELHELTSSLNNDLYNKVGVLEGKIASGDESLKSELKSIKKITTNLMEELDRQEKEISSLKEENSTLKEKVDEFKARNNEQKNRIEILQEENTRLENSIEKLNEKISNTNQSLESRMSNLQEKFMTMNKFDSLKNVVSNQGGKISSLERKIEEFLNSEGNMQVAPLKIGYVNATEVFNVFTEAVAEEREQAQAKNEELTQLREKAIQGEITVTEFNRQSDILQAEKLRAQLKIDLAMVEKMIDAPGFESISDRLKQLKSQVDPIMTELNGVLENMRDGSAAPEEAQKTIDQINSQYQQLDDLLTQLIETKIFQITNREANNQGYDLVFRQENVILYRNSGKVDDLTEDTKDVLRSEIG